MRDTPAAAAPVHGPAPRSRAADLLRVQRAAGNTALTALLTRPPGRVERARRIATQPHGRPQPGGAFAPSLRTALDSRLQVTASGGGYAVALALDPGAGKKLPPQPIATYRPTGTTPLDQLPVYFEDIVEGARAVVNIRYDPTQAVVEPAFTERVLEGVNVAVHVETARAEELALAQAPKARKVRQGMVVEGRENVTTHESASAIDRIMGSIASAEGGFASTEMSDAGVLTWGQGQWTVTAGELQRVMEFIKARRRDLFDRYWGAAGLDVEGDVFLYDGKRWSKHKSTMMELFRPNLEQIAYWARIFAQAGMDPQMQRLQREYLRAEVHETLGKRIAGHTPEATLDTRGQAYFYSMDKNLPAGARANFKAALESVQLPADGADVTDDQRAHLSETLGELFHQSSVIAYSNDKTQIIAFWGERGRKKALDLADARIAAGGGDGISVAEWKRYRKRMEARETRYQKTRADIDRAITHGDVEPDVPSGAFDGALAAAEPGPAAAPVAAAPATAAPTAPTAPASTPSAAPATDRGLADEVGAVAEVLATGVGLIELRLTGSVGSGGVNHPADVALVRARLIGLRFAPGEGVDGLVAAIERYQHEVVGLAHPDGRVDPRGPTVHALNSAGHPRADGDRPAGPHAAPSAPRPEPAAPRPGTDAAQVEAGPAPAGPRRPLSSDLEGVLAPLTSNPAVAEIARELGELQHLAPTIAKQYGAEEVGEKRRQLVTGINALRRRIAGLDRSGLDPDAVARIKPLLYRAIDDISPYYFQVTNVDILEAPPPDQTRTCNITSVSMALEALGKTPGDYKGDTSVIDAIAGVYESKLAGAQNRVGGDLTGLRLPDYLELAAIAQSLGKKPAQKAEIEAAAREAWGNILVVWYLVELAKRFGVSAHYQYFNLQGGGKKATGESALLHKHGDRYRGLTEHQVDVREFERRLESATGGEKKDLEWRLAAAKKKAEKLEQTLEANIAKGHAQPESAIEDDLPLEDYKRSIIQGIQPELDAGNQVVVSLSNHFTRLQAIHEEFLVIDDPGQYTRSNRHVTWSEARAMGYFWIWIVVGS